MTVLIGADPHRLQDVILTARKQGHFIRAQQTPQTLTSKPLSQAAHLRMAVKTDRAETEQIEKLQAKVKALT